MEGIGNQVNRSQPKKGIITKQLPNMGSTSQYGKYHNKVKTSISMQTNTRTFQICLHHKAGNLSENREMMSSQTLKQHYVNNPHQGGG